MSWPQARLLHILRQQDWLLAEMLAASHGRRARWLAGPDLVTLQDAQADAISRVQQIELACLQARHDMVRTAIGLASTMHDGGTGPDLHTWRTVALHEAEFEASRARTPDALPAMVARAQAHELASIIKALDGPALPQTT